MVSGDSSKDAAFRKQVRDWLKANLPKGWGTPDYKRPERLSLASQTLGEEWTKKCYDAGYTGFGYPKEYGGIARPIEEIRIIRDEMARTGTPMGPMSQGLLMAAPTILQWGQEWQKKRFLPKILSGEESWCQGFSEPDAGSDLANIRTVAARDGDDWIVNGQKVWTSNWMFADFGLLVCKTDLAAPRHRNLSYFIFDCTTPGFSRRPLRQMTDEAEFGELFFDNMRVPHNNLMGELHKGWSVAMTGLTAERSGGGAQGGVSGQGTEMRQGNLISDMLLDLAKKTNRCGKSLWSDPVYRQRIAEMAIESDASRLWFSAFGAKARKGGASMAAALSFEASVSKNYGAELRHRRSNLVEEMLGSYSQLMRGSAHAVNDGNLVYEVLRCRGATIEMGTTEVNNNIIAERVLGLPREDQVKKLF